MEKLRFKIPPPNYLVTFEAAGRCLNFTKAAGELNVSRVSVSQQVKALENHLSVKLFHRLHRKVKLTKAGELYHIAVEKALNDILYATYEIEKNHRSNSLTVTTTSGFSAYWLMPRIGRYRQQYPEIDIRFLISDQYIDFNVEDVDIGIRYGKGDWEGLDCEPLLREEIYPVCSNTYFANRKKPSSAKDLLIETLINLDGPYDRQTRWQYWFEANGVDARALPPKLTVNTYTNLVQAVQSGQGIALVGPPLIEEFLNDKSLIRPLVSKPISRQLFYIVTPKKRENSVVIDNFIAWIRKEAEQSEYCALPQSGRQDQAPLIYK